MIPHSTAGSLSQLSPSVWTDRMYYMIHWHAQPQYLSPSLSTQLLLYMCNATGEGRGIFSYKDKRTCGRKDLLSGTDSG